MIRVVWHWLAGDDPGTHTTDVRLAGRGYVGESAVRELVAAKVTGRREDGPDVAIDRVSLTPLNERNGQ